MGSNGAVWRSRQLAGHPTVELHEVRFQNASRLQDRTAYDAGSESVKGGSPPLLMCIVKCLCVCE